METMTPRALGYRMPAEWEPHEGTWLQWPQDKVYRGYELKLERIWLNMVETLHDHENVHIVVSGERQQDHIADQLVYHNIGLKNIDFYILPTNDVWARDNGPIFVVSEDGGVAITDWSFNGWGNRFSYDLDDQVPSLIGEQLDIPVFKAPMVLEGGAVGVNGKGTFLATRTSIIDAYRNPGMSQDEIESVLNAYKPIEKMSNKGIYVGFVEEFPEENKNFIQVLINIKFVKTNKSFTKFNQKLISYISDGTEIMNLEPGNKIIFNTSLIEINNNKNPGEFNIKSYYNSKKKL